jgi:hypothetical protein
MATTNKNHKNARRRARQRNNRRRRGKFSLGANFNAFGINAGVNIRTKSMTTSNPGFRVTGGSGRDPTAICCKGVEGVGEVVLDQPILAGKIIKKIPLKPESFDTRLVQFVDNYEMFTFEQVSITFKSHIAPVNAKAVGSIIIFFVPDPEEIPLETEEAVRAQAQRTGSVVIPVKRTNTFDIDLRESVRAGQTSFYAHPRGSDQERFSEQGAIYIAAYSDLDSETYGELFASYTCCLTSPSVSGLNNRGSTVVYNVGGFFSEFIMGDATDAWVRLPEFTPNPRIDVKKTEIPTSTDYNTIIKLPRGDHILTWECWTTTANLFDAQEIFPINGQFIDGEAFLVNRDGSPINSSLFSVVPESPAETWIDNSINILGFGIRVLSSSATFSWRQTAWSGATFNGMTLAIAPTNWTTAVSPTFLIPPHIMEICDEKEIGLRKRKAISRLLMSLTYDGKALGGLPQKLVRLIRLHIRWVSESMQLGFSQYQLYRVLIAVETTTKDLNMKQYAAVKHYPTEHYKVKFSDYFHEQRLAEYNKLVKGLGKKSAEISQRIQLKESGLKYRTTALS